MSEAFENALIEELEQLDITRSTIIFPRHLLFTCGGKVDVLSLENSSFRDIFMTYTAANNEDIHHSIVLAEKFKDYFKDNTYTDLLVFENDIAQLSTLVIIFLESPGSLVELGMFCSMPDSYKKLLIVAPQDKVENEDSFIFLGPLEYIRKKSPSSVLIYPWPTNTNAYDEQPLQDICHTILEKLEKADDTQRFSKSHSGHLAFLIAEIINISYPILISDIELALEALGIDLNKSTISRYIYLLSCLDIIRKEFYSNYHYYYPANPELRLVNFRAKVGDKPIDLMKNRMKITQALVDANDNASNKRKSAQKLILEKLEANLE